MRKPITLPFNSITETFCVNGHQLYIDVTGIGQLIGVMSQTNMAKYYTEVFKRNVSRRSVRRWIDNYFDMSIPDKNMSDAFTTLELKRLALEDLKKVV